MTDDLVQRLRRTYRKEYAPTGSIAGDISNRLRPFPILATEVLFNPDGREAADRIEAQAAEISKWHTVTRAYLDRIETLRAYNERLNKSAECLAETRRLAVKDLAALEAEIERLHRALLDVIECDPGAYEATIARAALEQSQ